MANIIEKEMTGFCQTCGATGDEYRIKYADEAARERLDALEESVDALEESVDALENAGTGDGSGPAAEAKASADAAAASAEAAEAAAATATDEADRALACANEANAAAQVSGADATNAAASASAAAASASTASSKASAAETSASNAADSAEAAAGSADTASAKATAASGSASTAASKATEASNAATSAASAKTAAETAQGAAEDAQEAAEAAADTATSKASAASTSATNAKTSETNAAASATEAAEQAEEASSSRASAYSFMQNASVYADNAAASKNAAAASAQEAAEAAASLGGGYTVPDYWQSAVDAAIASVKAAQDAGGAECVTFAYFSDLHNQTDNATMTALTDNIGNITAAVMNACNIPLCLMAGDTARNACPSTEAEPLADLEAAAEVLKPIGYERLMQIRGNHDDVYGSSGSVYYVNKIDQAKVWNRIFRAQAQDFRRVFGGDGSYFYIDNEPQKVRFICLNSYFYGGEPITDGTTYGMNAGYGAEQLEWLANEALPTDREGWSVVIASHTPPATVNGTDYFSQLWDGALFVGIVTAYCNKTSYSGTYASSTEWKDAAVSVDYSEATTAEVVGVFCGHSHFDGVITDALPCPVVTITSATNLSYDESEGTRTQGTATETAVDFVCVNKAEKTVSTVRLGIGGGRTFDYGVVAPSCTNQIPISTDASGAAYNGGAGWKTGYRLNSSGAEAAADGQEVTGFIPVTSGDVLRFANMALSKTTNSSQNYISAYQSDKSKVVWSWNAATAATNFGDNAVWNSDGTLSQLTLASSITNAEYIAYLRFSANEITDASVITKNEVIV